MSAATTVPGPRPGTITPASNDANARPAAGNGSGKGARPGAQGPSGRAVLGGLASIVVNLVAPLAAYHVFRQHHESSAVALALAGAIPVVWTLAILAVRRKLSALGVVSVALFAIGVLISWISGGSTLAEELQDPVIFGLFGLACLVSIAVGHPLHQVILRAMGRSNARYTEVAERAKASGTSMVSTLIIGVAFVAHAVAVAVLAFTQSTSTFLALQNPVGLPFIGLGLLGLFIYGSRQQARQRAAAATRPSPTGTNGDDHAEGAA